MGSRREYPRSGISQQVSKMRMEESEFLIHVPTQPLCSRAHSAEALLSMVWGNPSQVTHHRELPCFHPKDHLLSLPHALLAHPVTTSSLSFCTLQGLPLPPSPPPLSYKTGLFWASIKFLCTNVRVGVKIVTSICIFRGAFRGQHL